MKYIFFILIIYVSQIYAQQESDLEQYVDTLHGFSMMIPNQQEIKKDKYAVYGYMARESVEKYYKFYITTKKRFIEDFLSHYFENLYVDSTDTLFSIAKIQCINRYHLRLTGVISYFRIDSIIQSTNNHNKRIIEFHRTRVYEQPDGSIEYEKVGPEYFINLLTAKGEFILNFDFYFYFKEKDYNVCRNIVSSIKTFE